MNQNEREEMFLEGTTECKRQLDRFNGALEKAAEVTGIKQKNHYVNRFLALKFILERKSRTTTMEDVFKEENIDVSIYL